VLVAIAALGGLLAGWCLSVVSLRLGEGVPVLEGGVPRPNSRDLLTALATSALSVAVVLVKHGANEILLGWGLVAVLVPVTLTDVEHRLIPNKITAPGAVAAVLIGLVTHPAGVPGQLVAGLGAGLFLFLFAVIFRGALGMGDVKLGGVLGLYLSGSVVVAMVVGILAGGVGAVVVLARSGVKAGSKTKIAYGPYLALGGIVGLLAGPHILHWYSHSLH
jgi:leader peptidase (prepilin peptidase)/N-methyltransferase